MSDKYTFSSQHKRIDLQRILDEAPTGTLVLAVTWQRTSVIHLPTLTTDELLDVGVILVTDVFLERAERVGVTYQTYQVSVTHAGLVRSDSNGPRVVLHPGGSWAEEAARMVEDLKAREVARHEVTVTVLS